MGASYAYAVGNVRAREPALLTRPDMEQLLGVSDVAELLGRPAGQGIRRFHAGGRERRYEDLFQGGNPGSVAVSERGLPGFFPLRRVSLPAGHPQLQGSDQRRAVGAGVSAAAARTVVGPARGSGKSRAGRDVRAAAPIPAGSGRPGL